MAKVVIKILQGARIYTNQFQIFYGVQQLISIAV